MRVRVIVRNEETDTKAALIKRFKTDADGNRNYLPDPVIVESGHDVEVHAFEGCGFEVEAIPEPAKPEAEQPAGE